MSGQETARNERGPSRGQVEQAPAERPVLKIVNPDATPEEIAAVVAVFAALGGSAAPAPKRRRSTWASPARQLRGPLPASWRASSLPR